jgi:uncharacterized membrane protein YfcA
MEIGLHILAGGLLIASFVGMLTGLFGVGGGFLMTPALIVILGLGYLDAVATDLAVILVTSSFAMYRRAGSRTVDIKLGLVISAAALAGVFLGQAVAVRVDEMAPLVINGRELVTVTFVGLCAFVVLLVMIACYLALDYWRSGGVVPAKRVGAFAKLKLPPYMEFSSLEQPRLSVLPLLMLGGCAGMLSALMGIGGGVVLLPALIYLVGQRTVKAAGTSLLIVLVSAAAGVYLKAGSASIDYYLLAAMIVGGVTGTYFGTKLGLRISGLKLREYFIFVVFAAALLIAWRIYTMVFGATT